MASIWEKENDIDRLRKNFEGAIEIIESLDSWRRTLFCALVAERCVPALHAAGMTAGLNLSSEVEGLERVFRFLSDSQSRMEVSQIEAENVEHQIWDYPIGRQAVNAMCAIDSAIVSVIGNQSRVYGDLVYSYWECLVGVMDEIAMELDVDVAMAMLNSTADNFSSLVEKVLAIDTVSPMNIGKLRAWNLAHQIPIYIGVDKPAP